jgi:DNA-3-methyladenine glycosylase II
MKRIDTEDDLAAALDELVLIDPSLLPVCEQAGRVDLRRSEPGFASLASIVVSQQVSRASAEAILGRLVQLIDPFTPAQLLAKGIDALVNAGLSRAKQRTLLSLATSLQDGQLDMESLSELPASDAISQLTALPGIGPWTAEVYLLTAAGHPDIFPSGDVALQAAVGDAFGHELRPDSRHLAAIAEAWRPWRSVAARLFWAYYRGLKGREVDPIA